MLNKLTQYDSRLLSGLLHTLGGIVCCGIVLIVLVNVISPLNQEINRQKQETIALRSFLKNSSEINKRHQTLQEELTAVRSEWEQTLQQIPATAQESTYLATLSKQIELAELHLDNFVLGGMHHHESLKERDLTLELSGSYGNLCHLLNELDDLPRITNVQQLQISSPDPRQSREEYRINLKVRMAYDYQEAIDQTKSL